LQNFSPKNLTSEYFSYAIKLEYKDLKIFVTKCTSNFKVIKSKKRKVVKENTKRELIKQKFYQPIN